MNTPDMDLDAENRYRAHLIAAVEGELTEIDLNAIRDCGALTPVQHDRLRRWIDDHFSEDQDHLEAQQ